MPLIPFQSRASADGLETQGHAHWQQSWGWGVEFGERVGRELPNKTVMPVKLLVVPNMSKQEGQS